MEETFENEPTKSVSNRVNFFNRKLSDMKSKQAASPQRKKEEDADVIINTNSSEDNVSPTSSSKAQKWKDRVSAKKEKKKITSESSERLPTTNVVEDADVQEAEDIVNSFSDKSNGSNEDEEVLMHSMKDPEDDIPLEELFSTAASLDVRLETEDSANMSGQQQQLFTKSSEDQDAELEPMQEPEPTSNAAAIAFAAGVAALAAVAKPRAILYDTDDEDIESGAKHIPKHRFLAVPYSDGKRKLNHDGMSVTSDDISTNPDAGVVEQNEILPYTVLNAHPKEDPAHGTDRKYKVMVVLSCLLFLALIAILIWLLGLRMNPDDLNPLPVPPIPTEVPIPTEGPSALTSTMTPDITTLSPTEESTTMEPTGSPSSSPPVAEDFEATASFAGQSDGDRFGSVISLSSDGTFMVSLSNNPTDPIQTFQRRDPNGDWSPILALPVDGASVSFNSSLAFGADISCTTTTDGTPVVAVSSRTSVEVFQLEGGSWIARGQMIPWDVGTVSYSAMALSADAMTLAAGFVDDDGDDISVTLYKYDITNNLWSVKGTAPVLYSTSKKPRSAIVNKGNILSISLALSGDGNILTVQQWAVTDIQIVVQNFEFDTYTSTWEPMGGQLMVPYGPASIALSEDGFTVAVVATYPGKGVVFQWNGENWFMIGGNEVHGYLPGGSSVSIARNGSRLLIGDGAIGKALIYDYGENEAWMPVAEIWGGDKSSFGASVGIDEAGNTLAIGAPTSNLGGNNLGQVFIYQ